MGTEIDLVTSPNVAVMVALLPAVCPVTKPALLMLAADVDTQVIEDVRFCVVPSEYVPIAVI